MHRLLVTTEMLAAENPSLPKDAAKHLKVLRPENGETVELFDGAGRARTYRWNAATGTLGAPEPLRSAPEPAFGLTLFACITKGSRWDWTLEKATELGVTRIVPVISDRTIVRIPKAERAAKRERWVRIVEDAARQSDAMRLPEICAATDFRDALALVAETACFAGALVKPAPGELLAEAQARLVGGEHAALFTGPEGDFTPEELAALLKIAVPTTFGTSVLRAETAAIYGISVLASVMRLKTAKQSV